MLFTACPSTAVGARFCRATSTCLFADKICDGHQDCPDDSDEVNCSTFSALYIQRYVAHCLTQHR